MIIINISGGLGNQLFQLAFYHKLKSLGYVVKLNTSFYKDQNKLVYRFHRILRGIPQRKFLFDNQYKNEIISPADLKKTVFKSTKKFIFRKLLYNSIPFKHFIKITKKNNFLNENNFDEEKINSDANYYLDGYWQKYEYVKKSKNYIQKLLNSLSKSFFSKIPPQKSIVIHVRRGDQSTFLSSKIYTVLSKDYYEKAINFILELDNKIDKLIICSDDINWCKKNLISFKTFEKIYYMEETTMQQDFSVMVNSHYLVLSNSTFCWWAGFLGNQRKVILPKKWFKKDPRGFISVFDNFIEV